MVFVHLMVATSLTSTLVIDAHFALLRRASPLYAKSLPAILSLISFRDSRYYHCASPLGHSFNRPILPSPLTIKFGLKYTAHPAFRAAPTKSSTHAHSGCLAGSLVLRLCAPTMTQSNIDKSSNTSRSRSGSQLRNLTWASTFLKVLIAASTLAWQSTVVPTQQFSGQGTPGMASSSLAGFFVRKRKFHHSGAEMTEPSTSLIHLSGIQSPNISAMLHTNTLRSPAVRFFPRGIGVLNGAPSRSSIIRGPKPPWKRLAMSRA